MSLFDKFFRRKSIERIKRDDLFDAELRLHESVKAAESYRNSAAKEEADAKMLLARIKRLRHDLGMPPLDEGAKREEPAEPAEKPVATGRRLRAAN